MATRLKNFFTGKKIGITGACGTIGNSLLFRLLKKNFEVDKIIALDNSESALFGLVSEYKDDRIETIFADIRDYNSLLERLNGIDVLFHCAAMKHVNICEKSPIDAIKTNVLSTQNVIDAAIANKISEVVFSSSDKAVNPTNVLGASKLLGEKLISAAHERASKVGTKLMSVRFGNVLGSSGSVFHIFLKQIKEGSPLTITDNNMSRFVMTQNQAIELILDAPKLSVGGDVIVLKMPALLIKDLAIAMNNIFCRKNGISKKIKTIEIGASFGEKIYEELLNVEEVSRAVEHDSFYQILPVGYNNPNSSDQKSLNLTQYNSDLEKKLNIEQIENLIEKADFQNW